MKTVLAVDDSPSIRQMVGLTLRGAGYNVIEAVDGQDALEKATTLKIDAVLTDQNMPNLDGLGFIRAFRAHPSSQGIPVIFLSTDSADALKQEARSVGALGWMVKPFSQAQLLSVIQKVLG
ncbi:Chemotaxis response regulator, CheY3 [Roseovarius sp. EC-HK134]|jgi:two-component system chemotaxis response regulator CheY|uniref:Chemotaxis protein CheY n=1 Tax=Roseovarius mucosus TaxID=215743 RepID=A0A1V0RJZ4_9RHOB|nr:MULTISPECIES: response regulator [Roseovarius]ARE82036.1 chemotaxis protein CheY [Roseovarius mucosus]AWZ22074.1 Chemotaxis regulator - transmits chemoreceptor signals to flagelllar motor components CheY [Roseovarius sp. AK1035]EDM29816.1 Chemotaxis response regulator, CheY3 [Roseovarius sp. TM1035]MBW4972351.1 response regulator [Roseovarius mucosus]VVT27012.1 Chemotaxis response regulator, CheY3 [Roseovarius sp. EC-HK134]|tara:strand:- start:260 stop:622 length:363 start_codon:yes stop_codon:yes gene_type:complete